MKIDTTIRSMIFLQQYYKDHGVDILYVFAPGKGAYYKDDIPPKYKKRKTETNYEYFISRCQETQLNLLDYHAIFLNKKDTASKNLYPKYGIHWSSYSLPFVYDTLISRINSFSGNTTEDYSFTFVKDTNFLTNSDYDIIKPMNLLHYPIDKQSVGIRVNDIKDTPKSKRESIFVIGDSFYKTLYKDRVLQKLYHNRGYLYYGRDFYPHNPFGYDKNRSIENFNIMQTSLSSDVIIILGTEANLSLFPFDIQNVIIDSVFSEISDYEKEAYYHRLIDKDIKWENEIKEVASDDNQSYQEVKDSLVVMYIAEGYLDKEGVFRKKKLESIMLTIKNSTVWYEKIKEKAKKKNIPVEEELYLNAIWAYNNQKKK